MSLVAGTMLCAAPAMAETEFTTDLSLGAGASTNPYLENGPVQSTASGSISVAPRLRITDAATTFNLRGFARIEEYERNFRTNNSFGVNGSVEHGLSERTELRGSLGYRGSIVGVNDAFFNPPDVIDDNFLPVVADDIALNGLNQRRHTFQAGVGISHSFSELDSINADLGATAIRFADSVVQDEFNAFNQNIGYSRVLSDRTSVGASVGFSQVNYLGQRTGDSSIITPSVNISHQISQDFTITASAGVSFARSKNILGTTKSSDLAASFNLCRDNENNKLCIGASRQTLPTSFDGVRSQTAFNIGYSQQLNRDDSISLNGSYSRSSNSVLGVSNDLDYLRSSVTFNHKFRERFTGFVSFGYSDSYQDGINRKANTQVGIGIRLTFGNNR
ncbi:hypothetical protein [Parasphingorhabdus cellanae]|uniref:Uncharacterized protein n=1 Tax=Parasphingorhabdus cellanae TaxID=2806553 RepID=A0ABX7T710_9SPHN|nr:hypothetical protein [Parasphingorhabdus cellanae]QTD56249.1 hypothetical protein J4G78_01185 [Parasphingorhabdus cellanae]